MRGFFQPVVAAALGTIAAAGLNIGAAAAADIAVPQAEVSPPPAYSAPPPAAYTYSPPPAVYPYPPSPPAVYYGYAVSPAIVVPTGYGNWWYGPHPVHSYGVYMRGWGRGYQRW